MKKTVGLHPGQSDFLEPKHHVRLSEIIFTSMLSVLGVFSMAGAMLSFSFIFSFHVTLQYIAYM